MGLKAQVLLVGLLMLLLPWASVPVIKQFERALRLGQAQALEVTAEAIATQIIESRDLLVPLDQTAQRLTDASQAWFVPVARGEPALDGYFDEWVQFGACLDQSSQSAKVAECSLMRTRESVYIAVKVEDQQRQFFNPNGGLELSDHLQLRLEGPQSHRDMRIFSSAAGSAQVMRVDGQGHMTPEHRLKAAWSENGDSYGLELKIPANWLSRGLALVVCDGSTDCSLSSAKAQVYPVLLQNMEVQSVLAHFERAEVRTRVVLAGRWVVAEAGQLQNPDQAVRDTWLRWLLRWLVGQESLPNYPANGLTATVPEMSSALASGPRTLWYAGIGGAVAQTIIPLDGYQSSSRLGVIVEQNSHTIDAIAGGALGKLLLYSSGISLLVAMALLGYASILSLRIVRLNRSAQEAVDHHGRIRSAFPVSSVNDEIGELSRGYGALLVRLHSYTHYLESFSQKLSHELRTPIAIVRSSLDNLTSASDDQREVYLQRASEGLDRLSSIFNAMSAATRIEQALQASERHLFNVAAVMSELAEAYQALHPSQKWQFKNDSRCELQILGSAELIAQMMDKLIDNAVDFAGVGGEITIGLDANQQCVLITIANSGPLLPEQLQESIFDSMVSMRNIDLGGHHLGLGLHVVRLIVDFHGGQVRAYNHIDGKQVVFEIRIPKAH